MNEQMNEYRLLRKELKLSLSTDNMMLYIENPKESIKNASRNVEFSKNTSYKINIIKQFISLYTSDDKLKIEI